MLTLPDNKKRLLLHSCCAPCSGELMEALLAANIDYSIYFYNPNIHPKKEYEIRKNENIRFAKKYAIPFIDGDYEVKLWFTRAKGMENEPERGPRCTLCFDMRFERTARYAYENQFDIFTSSLGISRWKNWEQVTQAGVRAAAIYHPHLTYWTYPWRKNGGAERMYQIAKREQFYKQEYCGCAYSLRDANVWRVKNKRSRIQIGKVFYGSLEK